MISISLNSETVNMQSSWGFTNGFYLAIISLILAITSLFFEVKNNVCLQNKKIRDK
jgi:hypothetical protein